MNFDNPEFLLPTPEMALGSRDTEASVLSVLINFPAVFDDVSDRIKPAFFSDETYRAIFVEVCRQMAAGKGCDVVTLAESLTGIATLQEIHKISISHDHGYRAIGRMVDTLSDRYKSRQLHALSGKLATLAFETTPVQDRIDIAMAELTKLDNVEENDDWIGAHEASMLHLDLLESRQEGRIQGMETGLQDFDELLDGGLQRGNLVVIGARPSMGKCQPLDAKVLLSDGQWSRMGDLVIGDKLASVDGDPSVVTGIFPQGIKPVLRVTFSDGRSTECCAEHLWSVSHRKWRASKVMQASEVAVLLAKPGMDGRLWIEPVTGDFGTGDMPIDPWLLGALLGDGDMTQSTLRFSKTAAQTIERVRASLPETVEMVYAGGCDYRLSVPRSGGRSNPLMEAVRGLGLAGCLSADKFIPASYLSASGADRLGLLRGLLDTDGWVEKSGSAVYSTVSPRLARDVQALARSLGYWCSMNVSPAHYTYKGERLRGLDQHRLVISGANLDDLFLFEAKRERLVGRSKFKRIAFAEISPSREAECRCISVSHSSHLYVTDDYIVTHNTALAMTIGLHMAKKYAVGFLSMEMPHNDVRDRQAAILSSASISHIKRPTKGLDYGRIVEGVERSKNLKFYVSDKSGLNILQVRSKARALKRCYGLDVLVVDYIGLMEGLDRKVSRAYQIEEISRGLKGLAKELDMVVICLAQVNRAAADKGNNPPGLHELRDSGAIEQDADVVAFIHRQIMANPDAGEDYKNYGLLRVSKNRQGRCADVHLYYQGEYTKFSSWSGSAPSKALAAPSQRSRGFSNDD